MTATAFGVLEAVAFAFGLQNMAAVSATIQGGSGEAFDVLGTAWLGGRWSGGVLQRVEGIGRQSDTIYDGRQRSSARRCNLPFVADRSGFGHSAVVAYALSFGPDFFRNEEHGAVVARAPSKRPTSVEQPVSQLSEATWAEIARDVFGFEPEYLNIETVLQKIEETHTCLSLDSPIEVCIDRGGEFTVLVYDQDER